MAQGANDMPHVALCLAQVMRLGEMLTGKDLVRDLRLAAATVGVVHGGPLWGPLDAREWVAHVAIALRVHDDGAHAPLDRPESDPRLCDRLARTGGANDERVRSIEIPAGDRDGTAALIASENQPAVAEPCIRSQSPAAPKREARRGRANEIRWRAPARCEDRQIGAQADVVAVPATSPQRRAHTRNTTGRGQSGHDRLRRERLASHAARRPAPVQVRATHEPRGEE